MAIFPGKCTEARYYPGPMAKIPGKCTETLKHLGSALTLGFLYALYLKVILLGPTLWLFAINFVLTVGFCEVLVLHRDLWLSAIAKLHLV